LIVGFALIVSSALLLGLYVSRGWSSGRAEIRSLTVLPLENVEADPGEQYFVNGITDAVLTDLSRIGELQIIALPTDLRQPGPRDFAEIGRRLNVNGCLTGNVSRSADRIRVVIQLVQAPSGRNIWSKAYERDVRDVQTLHNDIVRDVVQELQVPLSAKDSERLSGNRAVVPEAYDHYLRGRFFLNTQNPSDQDTAIASLEQAVQTDPSFAAAYAELAQAYTWKHFAFAPEQKDLVEKAFIAVQKAFALDPEAAPAYLARGRLLWTPENNFPHEKAISDYRRALELDPTLDEARNQLALVYSHVGLLDEALAQAREGVRINPTNNLLQLRIGQTLNSQMKFEEALATLNGIPIKIHPSVIGHQTAWALFNLGRKDEALEKIEQLQKDNADSGGTFAAMKAVIAASNGNNDNAEELIAQAIENGKGYGHFHHSAYTIACAYAIMNKHEQAIFWLERAAETGFPCYPSFEKDSNLKNLRGDARFQAFLSKVKERWEAFGAMR
jgi:TolB-like protein/Tfp pilus assembly protein PilF